MAVVYNATMNFGTDDRNVVIKQVSRLKKFWKNELLMANKLLKQKATFSLYLYDWLIDEGFLHLYYEKAPLDLYELYEQYRNKSIPNFSHQLSYHMFCVAQMLIELHGMSLSHNDLKPENIVCRDASGIKLALIDFGECTENDFDAIYHMNTTEKHNYDNMCIGTTSYSHPSMFLRKPCNLFAHDLFSFAMMTVTLFIGKYLYNSASPVKDVIFWHNRFLDGTWPNHLLKFFPNLKNDALFVSFVDFVNYIIIKIQFADVNQRATSGLLDHEFLNAWRQI